MLHACLGEESTYQHIYICHLRPYFWLIRACFRQQRPQVHSFCNYIRFPVNLTNLEKKPEQKGKVFFKRLHVKHDFTLSRSVLTDGTKKKKAKPTLSVWHRARNKWWLASISSQSSCQQVVGRMTSGRPYSTLSHTPSARSVLHQNHISITESRR